MKKILFLAVSLIAILLISCEKEVVVTGVKLDKTTLAIPANGTGKLVANTEPTEAFGIVNWSSSNDSVATVVGGTVTGISEGTAQITAKVGLYTATCEVIVSPAITSVSFNISNLKLKVDSTQTITATILPVQSPAILSTLLWTSTNPTVATVDNNGKIIAISDGTTNIVASIGTVTAVFSVTVYTTVQVSLSGSNYYLFCIDASTASLLGNANIAADYRPDGANKNLFIWQGGVVNTFNAGTCVGTNFYGIADNWLSWVVASVGWPGGAFNVKAGTDLDKLKAVTDDTSGNYYLHFAIKSSTSNSYAFKMGYGTSSVTFVLGTLLMEGTSPYGNFTRNGQWQEIEIPMSYFKTKGLTYSKGMATTDVFVMLAGGTAGTKLEMDAIFIYKKP